MFSGRMTAFRRFAEVGSAYPPANGGRIGGRAQGTSATGPYRLPKISLAALAFLLLRACPSPKPASRLTGS